MKRLAFLLLAACQCPAPPINAPVAEITTSSGQRATATHLGFGTWVTNQHVLGDDKSGTLHHSRVAFLPIERGNNLGVGSDWVAFRTEPDVRVSSLPVDFDSVVPTGAHVWVVGFGSPDRDVAHRSNVLRAVVREPLFPEGKNVLSLSLLDTPDALFCGMSGGAVIYNMRVVAIISGRARYDDEVRQLAVRPQGW